MLKLAQLLKEGKSKQSMIIVDPKAELFEQYSEFLKESGYTKHITMSDTSYQQLFSFRVMSQIGGNELNFSISVEVEEVEAYTVTWNNWDGFELEKDLNVPAGTIPSYDGVTPTKEATGVNKYIFTGWDKEVSAVTEDVVYTAQFKEVGLYTVTWNNYDGSELEVDLNVEEGTLPVYNGETPVKPTANGIEYAFAGWSPVVSEVTGEITYTATFKNAAYDITGNMSGATYTWVESSANNAYLISTPDLASGTGFVLNVNLNQTFIAEKTYKFTLIYEYVSGASGQWFDVSSDWSGTNVKLTSGSVYPGVTSMRNFNGLTQKRDITETVEGLTLRFEINWNTTAAGEFKFGIKVEEVKELELTATDAGTTCTLIENPDDMISGTTTTYLVETTGATWPNITANINKKFEAGKSYKFTVKYAWYSGNSQWNFDYSITWSDGTTVSPTDGLRGGLSGDNYTVSITETTNVQTIILSIKWNQEQVGAFKLGIVVEEV